MRRRIDRKDEARADLDRHFVHIALRNPKAANRFLDAAEKAFRQLLRMPHAGDLCEFDAGELAGLRMWPIRHFENYVIFFRPTNPGIEIVRVLHAAQDFPSFFEPESGS